MPEIVLLPSFYIALAAGILILPLNWLLAAIVAAGIHEISHLLMIKACKIPIHSLEFRALGASISMAYATAGQELFCAAAGPIGSFCLLLVRRRFPLLSLLGFIQGMFNLLPVYPMDGGRILRSIFMLAKNRL